MLNLYPELLVKTLAVWYKAGNSEGGFWFLTEMEWPGKRKADPGFAESARKSRL